jgi:hypothetical protein
MKRLALYALCFASSLYASAQSVSYQGLWWNSPAGSQSGWGINIAHQGNILFATWFTYDQDGHGMWLVMPDAEYIASSDGGDGYYGGYGMMMPTMPTYSGTIYRTTGPAFDAAPFDGTKVSAQAMGSGTFQFSGADLGTFVYTINGATRGLAITRQVFSTPPDCTMGGAPSSTPNFSDLWWHAPAGSESGWGVNLTQQGDILFATWFTYDATGRGMWLVMSNGARTGPQTWTGAIYRTSGPAFDGPWDNAKVTATQAGTATFAFSDATNGTFSATVDGRAISEPITRQVYSMPASVCR